MMPATPSTMAANTTHPSPRLSVVFPSSECRQVHSCHVPPTCGRRAGTVLCAPFLAEPFSRSCSTGPGAVITLPQVISAGHRNAGHRRRGHTAMVCQRASHVFAAAHPVARSRLTAPAPGDGARQGRGGAPAGGMGSYSFGGRPCRTGSAAGFAFPAGLLISTPVMAPL